VAHDAGILRELGGMFMNWSRMGRMPGRTSRCPVPVVALKVLALRSVDPGQEAKAT
jgi:hypothetical protein